jgi:pSer/pThr/pTyr-binding forkhead associated (FHA) protein
MTLRLEPKTGGPPIPLDKAVLFIGRHPDCDVRLTGSQKVSRRHCCIAQVNDRWVVRDLGSMNGVTINGQKIVREADLKKGDELQIGDVGFTITDTGGRQR